MYRVHVMSCQIYVQGGHWEYDVYEINGTPFNYCHYNTGKYMPF